MKGASHRGTEAQRRGEKGEKGRSEDAKQWQVTQELYNSERSNNGMCEHHRKGYVETYQKGCAHVRKQQIREEEVAKVISSVIHHENKFMANLIYG